MGVANGILRYTASWRVAGVSLVYLSFLFINLHSLCGVLFLDVSVIEMFSLVDDRDGGRPEGRGFYLFLNLTRFQLPCGIRL